MFLTATTVAETSSNLKVKLQLDEL